MHHPKDSEKRRYGVSYRTQEDAWQFHGGHGTQTRLNTTNHYISGREDKSSDAPPVSEMPPRMCHTATSLKGGFECLLIGGRASPNEAFADCWLRRGKKWRRAEDLPSPRYRHSAVLVTDPDGLEGVLVYGGKSTDGAVVDDWLLWQEQTGWIRCESSKLEETSRFGATVIRQGVRNGYILGGMGEDGTISERICKWRLRYDGDNPWVEVEDCLFDSSKTSSLINRFGACFVSTPMGIYLIGGISECGLLPSYFEVVRLILPDGDLVAKDVIEVQLIAIQGNHTSGPLLMGHSALWDGTGIAIAGGGAVCFSFGTYWNVGMWNFHSNEWVEQKQWRQAIQLRDENGGSDEPAVKRQKLTIREQRTSPGSMAKAGEAILGEERVVEEGHGSPCARLESPRLVARVTVSTAESHLRAGSPVLFQGLSVGHCVAKWSPEYLASTIGRERQVRYDASQCLFRLIDMNRWSSTNLRLQI